MTFQESIRVCMTKYADFNGTASRPEYWWFFLFLVLAGAVCSLIAPTLGSIFSLATLIPILAAGSRRLHETGRSGWMQLIGLIPVAGVIILIVLLAQKAK